MIECYELKSMIEYYRVISFSNLGFSLIIGRHDSVCEGCRYVKDDSPTCSYPSYNRLIEKDVDLSKIHLLESDISNGAIHLCDVFNYAGMKIGVNEVLTLFDSEISPYMSMYITRFINDEDRRDKRRNFILHLHSKI